MKTVQWMVVVVGVAVAGAAFAQGTPADKKPAPAPASAAAKPPEGMGMPMKPAPEMDQMKGMVGTWKCDGKMSGDGMEMPMKSTYKVGWDMDNMWLVGHLEGAKAKGMPKAYKGLDYYTYDPEKKEFVMLSLDNVGMYGRSTTKGWEGDTTTWTGKAYMGGHESDTKMTITRKGDKEVHLEMSETAPGHTMTGTVTCKK
jgi:hypothetical protein